MPKEQAIKTRPALKLPIELRQLVDEGLLQGCGLGHSYDLGFARIGKHGYCNVVKLNQLRLCTEKEGVLPLHSRKDVEIPVKFLAVIPGHENDRSMIGHPNQHVDPQIPFLDGCFVGRKIAIDDEDVGIGTDGVRHKPFQTLCGITEVAVLIEMHITTMRNLQHCSTPFARQSLCDLNHNFAVRQ